MYRIKARYYAERDCLGESFVLTSDNREKDLKLEIGQKVKIVPVEKVKRCICGATGEERTDRGLKAGVHCDSCWENMVSDCRKQSW